MKRLDIMACIFDELDEIPVWSKENGRLICRDMKSGAILKESTAPTLPDGDEIEYFTPYKAILINNIEDISDDDFPCYLAPPSYLAANITDEMLYSDEIYYTIPAGTEVYVGMKPNGEFYLSLNVNKTAAIGHSIDLSSFSFMIDHDSVHDFSMKY